MLAPYPFPPSLPLRPRSHEFLLERPEVEQVEVPIISEGAFSKKNNTINLTGYYAYSRLAMCIVMEVSTWARKPRISPRRSCES